MKKKNVLLAFITNFFRSEYPVSEYAIEYKKSEGDFWLPKETL